MSDHRDTHCLCWLLIFAPAGLFVAMLLLTVSHMPKLVDEPLSNFRHDTPALIGYCMFALLITMGIGQILVFLRVDRREDIWIISFCSLMLLIVTVTDSLSCGHNCAALLLMFLLFCYYGTRLFAAESPVLFIHLAVPILMALGSCFHLYYGFWQKLLIVYFVVCIVIDTVFSLPRGSDQPPRSTHRR